MQYPKGSMHHVHSNGKTPQVLCQPAASSWWWTWMTVAGTVYHNPQVWFWSSGYRLWALSTSEDPHLQTEEESSQHYSIMVGFGNWDILTINGTMG